MNISDRILVTGGTGLVGKALESYLGDNTLMLSSKMCDLRDFEQTMKLFNDFKPNYVFHLAAKVGGVVANTRYVGDFYRENSMINTNVLEASRLVGANKVLSLLSTCIYPDKCPYPLREEDIHAGEPHASNFAYAYAKRMLDVQSRAYRQHDNYDLENSHVIPAMIRKFHEANMNGHDVIMWGSGAPMREFTYSEDLAKILVFLMRDYDEPTPINVGNTLELSIKDLAETLSEMMNFKGNIIWDLSKPDGQLRKPSNGDKLISLGWSQDMYTDHETALRETCDWSVKNYKNLRGVK